MYEVDYKYMDFLESVFLGIRAELDRLYWNKNQEEMVSPFDNTGESYSNPTFTIRAYDWNLDGEDENEIPPNFEYKGFKLWWYKHIGRGMTAKCDEIVDAEYIFNMHNECKEALKKDFGEEYPFV